MGLQVFKPSQGYGGDGGDGGEIWQGSWHTFQINDDQNRTHNHNQADAVKDKKSKEEEL